MLHIVAGLIAGLGLFFYGLHTLTEHFKVLGGYRLRRAISEGTKHPLSGVAWGGVLVGLTQSTTANVFVLIGMTRAGLLSLRQALPIVIGTNLFAGTIVYLLVFDIDTAVLLILGVTALIATNDRMSRYRHSFGAIFSLTLIFFGLGLMEQSVAPLAETDWFNQLLTKSANAYFVLFIVGTLLAALVQSGLAVSVIAISFYSIDLLTLPALTMVVYGANFGASVLTLLLSWNLVGRAKQISFYHIAYNVLGAVILLILFYVEQSTGTPMIQAAIETLSSDAGTQGALFYIAFNALPGLVLLMFLRISAVWLDRLYPETLSEEISKPRYLTGPIEQDPAGQIDLAALEQGRLVDLFSNMLDAERTTGDKTLASNYQDAYDNLAARVKNTLSHLSLSNQLATTDLERLAQLQTIQDSLDAAVETLKQLTGELQLLRQQMLYQSFADSTVEGIDTIVLTLAEVVKSKDNDEAMLLNTISSNTNNCIANIRKHHLEQEKQVPLKDRSNLLAATGTTERMIWQLGKLSQQFMNYSTNLK